MNLSARGLRELVEELCSNAPAGMDKRRQPRVGLRARATMILRDQLRLKDIEYPVWIRDVSAGGLCILADQRLHAGDGFWIRLGGPDDESVPCQVRHVRQVPPGRFVIGAKFQTEMGRRPVARGNAGPMRGRA